MRGTEFLPILDVLLGNLAPNPRVEKLYGVESSPLTTSLSLSGSALKYSLSDHLNVFPRVASFIKSLSRLLNPEADVRVARDIGRPKSSYLFRF